MSNATGDPPVVDMDGRTYRTIVADPPWRYGNLSTRGSTAKHYDTLSIAQIKAMDVPSDGDAHLYLWVTNGFLAEGLDVVKAWGFTYKTALTWCKTQMGLGNYFRNNTEHVLFAVKGKMRTTRRDIGTWFQAPRADHSAKPGCFYDIVTTSSPGPYLELFGREVGRDRSLLLPDDWDVWGNQ